MIVSIKYQCIYKALMRGSMIVLMKSVSVYVTSTGWRHYYSIDKINVVKWGNVEMGLQ